MISTKKRTKKMPEAIVNDDPKLFVDFPPGSVSHQGDLMIVAIAKIPSSVKARTNRQLADGDTQGSRHVMTRGDVFDADLDEVAVLIEQVTGCQIGQQYIGPVFVSPECPTCDDLSHPEHGNQGFPAGTVCAVVYQRSLDAELREVRVQD